MWAHTHKTRGCNLKLRTRWNNFLATSVTLRHQRGRINTMSQSQGKPGYLALVLHAHLPFVRHPEHPKFLEESWLFEAVTETYLPLLQVMEQWLMDGMETRLTLSLTPTLCSMLLDP